MKQATILVLLLLLASCAPRTEKQPFSSKIEQSGQHISFKKPRNIIFLVGDGMGLTQISAAMYMNGNKLNLEQFPYIGLHKTHATDDLVTDSAAGATAFSCGIKTYNAAIGVDINGNPVKTIMEEAISRGYRTGIVVTSSITHATPASFYAHQKERKMMDEIAANLPGSGVNFFVGGGKKYFDQRKDEVNLIDILIHKGYVISDYMKEELADIEVSPEINFGYFTANGEPLPFSQGRDYFVGACNKAIKYLSAQKGNGFFLLIEASQIDWGGHANNVDYIVSELLEFDKVIGYVLDFAKNDGETLVIVTADHETGGFAINPGSTLDTIIPDFTTDKHTATMVPVFATGPGAELFGGIYENTSIYTKMKMALHTAAK